MRTVGEISTANLEREEWLELRNQGVGGSDIATILGLSRYKSRRVLWLEKTKIKAQDDLSDNDAVYWGNVHEETVAREFALRSGLKVRKKNAMLFRKDKPFMLANVDRMIVGKKEGLECKTAHEYKKGEWSEQSVPPEYFLQCQWYLAVTGFERWHLAVLIGGNKFFMHTIERDEELLQLMEIEAEDFWMRQVVGGEAPQFVGSDDEKDYLSTSYPVEDKDSHIDLPGELFTVKLQRYDELKSTLDVLSKEKTAIENEIKDSLGKYQIGFIGERMVKWSGYETTRLDSKGLKAAVPETYERFAKTSYTRKFSVN